jgi:DNA-directed RNA polymerase specialized sigma24 family protein
MTVKEYLSQAWAWQQAIQRKRKHLAVLKCLADDTAGHISDMPRASSPNPQRMEDVLIKVVDLEREIAEDEKAMYEARQRVASMIAELSDTGQMQVLMKRYLEYKGWMQIQQELGVGERWVHRLHQRAVEALEKIFAKSLEFVE